MKERISCFDIDGTLAKGMLFVPLVKSEHESGHLSDVSFRVIQELLGKYKAGEIEYEDAVQRLLVSHAEGLKGRSYDAVKSHAETFLVDHEFDLFRKFGKVAVELLGGSQKLFVVTAEPQYLAESVADIYTMTGYISTQYELWQGLFTGAVTQSLADRSAKSVALQPYEVQYAFGDSEGDIDMLQQAENPFCISPTLGLKDKAEKMQWSVYDGDDNEEIVEAIKRTM